MATEPISTAYFIKPSHQSVCLYVYPSYRCKATARLSVSLLSVLGNGQVNKFPQQRIHATIEGLLDASFCMRSVSYQRIVCGSGLCIPRSLLGNDSVNMFPWKRRIVGGVVFCPIHVVSKENRDQFFPESLMPDESYSPWPSPQANYTDRATAAVSANLCG
jgi:hypothetical protein